MARCNAVECTAVERDAFYNSAMVYTQRMCWIRINSILFVIPRSVLSTRIFPSAFFSSFPSRCLLPVYGSSTLNTAPSSPSKLVALVGDFRLDRYLQLTDPQGKIFVRKPFFFPNFAPEEWMFSITFLSLRWVCHYQLKNMSATSVLKQTVWRPLHSEFPNPS